MEIKDFTFRLLQLGVPGIACYFLLKKLVGKIGSDTTEAVLSIFVFSILCYAFTDSVLATIALLPGVTIGPAVADFGLIRNLFADNSKITAYGILFATISSAPVALIVSAASHRKWWNRLAQKIHVSPRYGDEDLFNYFLNGHSDAATNHRWYVVRDHKEDLIYFASIGWCSDHGKDRELILTQVDVYPNTANVPALLYSCATLYICRKCDDVSIEVPHQKALIQRSNGPR